MNHWDTVKNVRGIYKITNKINGKVYIGQSVDIGRRWRQHMTAKDDIYFHKAIQKYGVDNFIWEVIEKCKKSELDERESYWIEYYDSFNKGYNCTKGGEGVSGGEDHPQWKGGVSLDEDYYRQYSKQYYRANKEEAKEYNKQYYEANKEKKKEYDKEYYEVNKEKKKEYYEVNKEKRKQYRKQYYEVNKEELKEKAKQHMKEHYEANKEKKKEYNEANKEKIKQYMKQYNETNKEKIKEYHRQRNKKSMKNTLFN